MPENKKKVSEKQNAPFSLEEFMKKHRSLEIYFFLAIFLILLVILYTIFVHPVSNTNNNVSNCSSIILSSYKDSCILSLAENQSNPVLCRQLPSSTADQCYSYIAQETLNASLCYASGSTLSQSCIVYVATKTDNPLLCPKLIGNNSTNCSIDLAINNNKSSSCNYLTNSSAKIMCYSSLNLSLAYKTKSTSYCTSMSGIKNDSFSNNIIDYSGVSLSSSGSNSSIFYVSPLSYLESLQNISYSPKDICYITVSMSSKNSTYCNEIKNQTLYSLCSSSSYYSNTNNVQTTNSSKSNSSILNISKQFSENFNYSSILRTCLNYSNTYGTGTSGCNYTVSIIHAITTRNVSYCPSGNITYSYQCYYLLAKTLNQTKYCSYILNATQNSACYQSLTNNISET